VYTHTHTHTQSNQLIFTLFKIGKKNRFFFTLWHKKKGVQWVSKIIFSLVGKSPFYNMGVIHVKLEMSGGWGVMAPRHTAGVAVSRPGAWWGGLDNLLSLSRTAVCSANSDMNYWELSGSRWRGEPGGNR